MADTPQQKGGIARSRSLSAQERSRIAREAALKRWGNQPVKAVHGSPDTPIRIADIEVPCFILADDRRVVATNGVLDAFGLARGGAMIKGMHRLELFAAQERLKPYVSDDLLERVASPIRFKIGSTEANGFDADTLIEMAEAVVAADDDGALQAQQVHIAHQCRVITRSLTRVGLIALIDEATGYQSKRDSDELQQILTAYIRPEHRPWIQTIPREFTDELYRVYGWERKAQNRGPRYAGKLIRELIYEKMPKPVLPKLDEVNPSDKNYQRKRKHHQYLTDKQGLDHFRSQVITMMTLLRVSSSKEEFKRNLRKLYGDQLEFDF
ncbi:P63C domain-containing protein [uncultured Ruegeria sp.]|uniref:P63C domain-containing protein n=1 Tax=uncultured Ruegeria sp. TaxID=259304 RepID=UPI00262944A6|nr:P63C domain-containing protein [uncultured Ruegeria sp.]